MSHYNLVSLDRQFACQVRRGSDTVNSGLTDHTAKSDNTTLTKTYIYTRYVCVSTVERWEKGLMVMLGLNETIDQWFEANGVLRYGHVHWSLQCLKILPKKFTGSLNHSFAKRLASGGDCSEHCDNHAGES